MYFSIGSCRINNPLKNIVANTTFNFPNIYTHSTKEVIQLLDFLSGKINSDLYEKKKDDKFKFNHNDTIIIEISTNKIHLYEDSKQKHYVNNVKFDEISDSNISKHFYYQSNNEIIEDLNIITNMLNCNIVFVGNIIPIIDSNILNSAEWVKKVYDSRINLHNVLFNYCQEKNKISISYCDINKIYNIFKPEELLEECNNIPLTYDLNHYKPCYFDLIEKYLTNKFFYHNTICVIHTVGKIGTCTLLNYFNKLGIPIINTNHNWYEFEEFVKHNTDKHIIVVSGIRFCYNFINSCFIQNLHCGNLTHTFIMNYNKIKDCVSEIKPIYDNIKYKILYEYNNWLYNYILLFTNKEYLMNVRHKKTHIFTKQNITAYFYKFEYFNSFLIDLFGFDEKLISNSLDEKKCLDRSIALYHCNDNILINKIYGKNESIIFFGSEMLKYIKELKIDEVFKPALIYNPINYLFYSDEELEIFLHLLT